MEFRLEKEVSPALADRLDQFLPDCPNAHHTMHPGWLALPGGDPRAEWIAFLAEEGGDLRAAALVRVRKLPLVGDSLVDVFRGPAALTAADFLAAVAGLERALVPLRPMALRIDPYWSGLGSAEIAAGLAAAGFQEMSDHPWPARSLETPIDVDPALLLQSYRGNTRRDVQKAQRMNVESRQDLDDEGVAAFHRLYCEMVARKGAEPRAIEFWRGLRDLYRAWPRRGFFLSSWRDRELLGAVAVFTVGQRAVYAYGASSAEHPEIPKNHLLQHEAMLLARERGCTLYDMGGFAAGAGDPENRTPAQKINFFKSGFGGREVNFVPGHERVLNPALLGVVRQVERLRKGTA